MKNSNVIKAILLTAIREVVSNPSLFAVNPGKDFSRNRKLGILDLIKMLLTMEAECIKEELYLYFGRITSAPSKSAFFRQRGKLSETALPNLFYSFNKKLPTVLSKEGYQLIACDGSSVEIYRNPDDPDTFFGPNEKSRRGYNQVHINAFYSILDKKYTNLVVQPGRKKNEYRAFCQMVDDAGSNGPKTIYIADMGYASYNNFAHVIENNQYFAIRCNDRRLEGILGSSVQDHKEMDAHFDRILTRTTSKKKRLHPELADQYRCICKAVPMDYLQGADDEYSISLRVIRFELSPGCYENIITNLPDLEFDFYDFIDLYHMRWSEENSFRDLKYPLCLKEFHSRKYEFIVQEIWARAILYNFSSAIIIDVEVDKPNAKHVYQVNFAEAFKTCRAFLRESGSSCTMDDVEGLIAQNIEPVRPGRTFIRQHRFKPPFSFCYRN